MKARKQSKLERDLEEAIYNNRLLVFIECGDGFRQVLLSKKHFEEVSVAVSAGFTKLYQNGKVEVIKMHLSEKVIPLDTFEGLDDYGIQEN